MDKTLKEQLKKLRTEYGRINPDRAWVVSNRENLLGQAKNTTDSNAFQFNLHFIYQITRALVPAQLHPVVKPLVIMLLMGTILTSGWIASASATENCLPGDVCYGVKMATEKTQAIVVAMTGTQKDKARLHLEFASRRAKEVKKVVEVKKEESPKQVEATIQKLEDSIKTVNDTIQNVKENEPQNILQVKQEVEKKTDEIKQTLSEVDEKAGGVDMTEATKVVKDTNLAATEAVVVTKTAGKVEVSDAEVKTMVEKAINDSLNDGGDVKEQGKITTEMAKQIEQPIVTTTPTTQASVKTVVDLATKQVDDTKKNLEDAQTMVNDNKLLEAIQAVKTANDVTDKAGQAVQQIKTAVEVVTEKVIVPVASSTIVIVVNTSTPVVVTSTINNKQ